MPKCVHTVEYYPTLYEGNPAVNDSTGEPYAHFYARWNKPATEARIVTPLDRTLKMNVTASGVAGELLCSRSSVGGGYDECLLGPLSTSSFEIGSVSGAHWWARWTGRWGPGSLWVQLPHAASDLGVSSSSILCSRHFIPHPSQPPYSLIVSGWESSRDLLLNNMQMPHWCSHLN